MQENIEVEIKSLISKEKYEELLEFFLKNSELIKEDYQETFYFDLDSNLRIQRGNNSAKLWHKSGKVHDEFMEEIEIEVKRNDFENLEKFLNKLGHSVKIKWFRKRKQFNWLGIIVSLDHTKNYAYIIELEIMSSEENKEKNLELLKEKFKELKIEITSKEKFKNEYENYAKNWRELTKNELD